MKPIKKVETPENKAIYETMIGIQVFKTSKKPFKSGEKIGTISGFGEPNPYTNRMTFTFLEDDSTVECFRCKILKDYHDIK